MKNVEYKDYSDMSAGTVEVRYPPYTLWKISATQSFGSHVRLSLALDNIFNYKPEYYYLNSPLTAEATFTAGISVGLGCLVGSFFIFAKQLRIRAWGANIRMAIPAVIVFWTPVEIFGRMNLFQEIWIAPLQHKTGMLIILGVFVALAASLS